MKIETRELLCSTVVDTGQRLPKAGRADPAKATNRRTMITGLVISGIILCCAMVWQYVDDQSAPRSPNGNAAQSQPIGSIAVGDADANP